MSSRTAASYIEQFVIQNLDSFSAYLNEKGVTTSRLNTTQTICATLSWVHRDRTNDHLFNRIVTCVAMDNRYPKMVLIGEGVSRDRSGLTHRNAIAAFLTDFAVMYYEQTNGVFIRGALLVDFLLGLEFDFPSQSATFILGVKGNSRRVMNVAMNYKPPSVPEESRHVVGVDYVLQADFGVPHPAMKSSLASKIVWISAEMVARVAPRMPEAHTVFRYGFDSEIPRGGLPVRLHQTSETLLPME